MTSLFNINGKKAIIFDMDGVVFDTTKSHVEAFLDTFKQIPGMFDYRKYYGMSTADTLNNFLKNEEFLQKLTKEKQRLTLEYLHLVELTPYADKILMLLKNKGFKVAIATSGSKERTLILLKDRNLLQYFDIVLAAEDIAKAKPAPDIYLEALRRLSISAEEALVIEDAPNGIKSAKAAGIETIGLLQTHKADDLNEADHIIRDIYSFYTIINYQLNNSNKLDLNGDVKKVAAIIPAAGKGTRLGFNKNKVLYPLLDTTPLEIICNKLKSISSRIIILSNKEGESDIKSFLHEKKIAAEVIVDPNPHGTAGTIACSLDHIENNEDVLVIWADQIGISEIALKQTILAHQKEKSSLTIPVLLRKNPYIHIERDENGSIVKVLRQRFSHVMPEYGENETGVFVIKSSALSTNLIEMEDNFYKNKANKEIIHSTESDFLDIIPILALNEKVLTVPCIEEEETIGMNDLDDAKFHGNRMANPELRKKYY